MVRRQDRERGKARRGDSRPCGWHIRSQLDSYIDYRYPTDKGIEVHEISYEEFLEAEKGMSHA